MDHERFAGKFLRSYSGQIGQPVMGMDEVELVLVLHGYGTTYHSITRYLFHEVGTILP